MLGYVLITVQKAVSLISLITNISCHITFYKPIPGPRFRKGHTNSNYSLEVLFYE